MGIYLILFLHLSLKREMAAPWGLPRGPHSEVPPLSAVPQRPQRTMAGFWLSTGLRASSGPERPKAAQAENQKISKAWFLLESWNPMGKTAKIPVTSNEIP